LLLLLSPLFFHDDWLAGDDDAVATDLLRAFTKEMKNEYRRFVGVWLLLVVVVFGLNDTKNSILMRDHTWKRFRLSDILERTPPLCPSRPSTVGP
jgi:hypothetical protein